MLPANEEERHRAGLRHGGVQAFMELARQSPQLIGGLPEPMVQAINRNDTEELQRILRCSICAGAPNHKPSKALHPHRAPSFRFCRADVLGWSDIALSALLQVMCDWAVRKQPTKAAGSLTLMCSSAGRYRRTGRQKQRSARPRWSSSAQTPSILRSKPRLQSA